MEEQVSDGIVPAFNSVHFINFLKNNNILATTIAILLSGTINDITTTFVEHLVMPVINRDGDGDGVRDIKKLEDVEFTVYNTTFKVGKVVLAFFKFIIITYIIFIIAKSVKKVTET